MSPDGSSSFGVKISRPTEHCQGTGGRSVTSRLLRVVASGATLISTRDSWTCEAWLWERQDFVSDTDLEHTRLSRKNLAPNLQGIAT